MNTGISTDHKTLLCISGLDPSGGAGIQADIEVCHAHGVHCLPMVSVNTVQDSSGIFESIATAMPVLRAQFKTLANDLPIHGVKIGMLANEEQASGIAELLDCLDIPVVLDPVLSSGLGSAQKSSAFIEKLCDDLLPRSSLLTPNAPEARQLASYICGATEDDIFKAGQCLLQKGCSNVLITGGHEENPSENLEHQFFSRPSDQTYNKIYHTTFSSPRLAGQFHGSGCTLASAIACNMVLGQQTSQAVKKALQYTSQSLMQARRFNTVQDFPRR